MSKVYFVRHQAAGILTDYPFAAEPTESQLKALTKLCFQSHGAQHPKTGEPFWVKVVEMDLIDSSTVLEVPEVGLSVAGASGLIGETIATGVGRVINPKGK